MSTTQKNQLPVWFWVVAVVTLTWNLMGVMAFISSMTMTAEALAELPTDQAELYRTTPIWATAAFGIAVFGGTLGCIGLLLRRAWSKIVFIVSLCGIFVQMIHAFFISNSFEVFGPGGMIMPIIVIVIATGLVWLAVFAKKNVWIV